MKKLLSVALALALCMPFLALGESLTYDELSGWAKGILSLAAGSAVSEGEGYEYGGYLLYPLEGELTADCALDRIEINAGCAGAGEAKDARGLTLGAPVDLVLSAYPLDNEALSGTASAAALYINGALPGAVKAGILYRDGQNITQIEHRVYYLTEGGVCREGLSYLFSDGAVTAITAFGLSSSISRTDADAEIEEMLALQSESGYIAYETESSDPFSREDFTFGGLDFIDLTPDDATALLGAPESDERLADADGTEIRVMQWADFTVNFRYGADGKFMLAEQLLLDSGAWDGPRGIRVTDTLSSVLTRFLDLSEGSAEGMVSLYGDGVIPPYGIAEYALDYVTVRYTFLEGDRVAALILTFSEQRLSSMLALYI